ncbi:MAG: hypothetical protein Q9186_006494 [Xanthomendoza sp. 1 TL-2023]
MEEAAQEGMSANTAISQEVVKEVNHQGLELIAKQTTEAQDKAEPFMPVVDWQPGNHDHPRNWPLRRRIYDTGTILVLEFFTTLLSTAVTPIAPAVQSEFGINHTMAIAALLSMYLVGQAAGILILSPYSEAFGRRTLFVVFTGVYSVFSVFTGVVPSISAVFIGRFIMGFASAVPSAVTLGNIEDMWNFTDRGILVYMVLASATVPLGLGPIMGAYIADGSLGWHWLFYIAAIVTGVLCILCMFMRESRPSRILRRKVYNVQKETGARGLQINNPDQIPDARAFVQNFLSRPARLFFGEPIVWLVSILSAAAYALVYLLTDAIPLVYTSAPFSFTAPHASLIFIAIGIGPFLGLPIHLYDRRCNNLARKSNTPLTPEDKLLGFYITAPFLAAALWWFSWSIPPLVTVHWFCSVVSLTFVGFAANEFPVVLEGYLIDTYTTYAASALVPCGVLRNVLSAVLPLFGREMFEALGANVASSILAAAATVFCVVPWVFWKYGKKIRESSPYARELARQ